MPFSYSKYEMVKIDNNLYVEGFQPVECDDGQYLRIFNKWTARPLLTKVTDIKVFLDLAMSSVAHQHLLAHLSLPVNVASHNAQSLLVQFAMTVKEFVERLTLDGWPPASACQLGNTLFFIGKIDDTELRSMSSSAHYFYEEAASFFEIMAKKSTPI